MDLMNRGKIPRHQGEVRESIPQRFQLPQRSPVGLAHMHPDQIREPSLYSLRSATCRHQTDHDPITLGDEPFDPGNGRWLS